jgi:hypothetical protein
MTTGALINLLIRTMHPPRRRTQNCLFVWVAIQARNGKGEETLCAAAPLAIHPDALQTMGPRTHFRFQQNVQGRSDHGGAKEKCGWREREQIWRPIPCLRQVQPKYRRVAGEGKQKCYTTNFLIYLSFRGR